MGNIVECERKVSKSDDVFNVVAYDNLFNLQKSSDNVYFASGKKTKSILTAIFKSWGITISKYTGPNVAHKKILLKTKSWETLSGRYWMKPRKKVEELQ